MSICNERANAYDNWKKRNQDVIDIFERLALEMVSRKRRFSFTALLQHIRWNEFFQGKRDSPYRLSNNHSPYIARDLIKKYPQILEYAQINRCAGEDQKPHHGHQQPKRPAR